MRHGIPQIIEALSLVIGLWSAYKAHGKPITTKEVLDLFNTLPKGFHTFMLVLISIGNMLWVLNAALGGAHGVFLIVYAILCGIMWQASRYIESNEERMLAYRKNFFHAFGSLTLMTLALYYAGFWTIVTPSFP